MKNLVIVETINGRTYVDVLDLIRAIERQPGPSISKSFLIERLHSLDEQRRANRYPEEK